MIGLIYNEVSKIVAQRRFLVVIIVLTLIAILGALVAKAVHGTGQLMPTTAAQSVNNGVSAAAQLLFPFLFAIIMGDIIAGELNGGTMKLLLIRPVARWKVWLSKLIGAYLACTAIVIYSGLLSYVALGATIGFGSFSAPEGGMYNIAASAGFVTAKVYALELASIFSVISTFLLISTFVESGVAAVGLCASLTVFCSVAVAIFRGLAAFSPRARILEYLFFSHWQIAGLGNSSFPFQNWTITGSLVTLAVWSLLFIAIGIAYFKYKDVKG
jgi:ABC-2 type transport system permease protein